MKFHEKNYEPKMFHVGLIDCKDIRKKVVKNVKEGKNLDL